MKVIVENGCFKPTRAHEFDAGLDLYSPVNISIPPQTSAVIDTGVHVEIPHGYGGFLISKSGLNVNHGIVSTGLIDSGYQGSIKVKLYNHDPNKTYTVNKGDKITQLVISPCALIDIEYVDSFDEETERGSNGFGSTGR